MTRPRPAQGQAHQAALSAALSGAVDLSGLKARAEAQRAAPPAGAEPPAAGEARPAPASTGEFVVEVTEANLQQLIEQSMQVPVILEFWMAGADQSQQYGDLLIRLAQEGQGAWLLGRVEVQEQMRVAQAMRLQGVPAIRIIAQGQMLDGVDGLLPESEMRKILQQIVEQTGGTLPEGAGPIEDPRIAQAEDALAEGDYDGAEAIYNSLLADDPQHPLARDALTQLQLMKRLDSSGEDDVAAELAAADANPDDIELAMKAADLQVASGNYDAAFARLLHFVRGSDADAKETARTRLIELFAIVGNAEPAVATARRDLTSALF